MSNIKNKINFFENIIKGNNSDSSNKNNNIEKQNVKKKFHTGIILEKRY